MVTPDSKNKRHVKIADEVREIEMEHMGYYVGWQADVLKKVAEKFKGEEFEIALEFLLRTGTLKR